MKKKESSKTKTGILVIRADATTEVGTGHVMRSLALAQHWKRKGGTSILIGLFDSKILENRVRHEGHALIPLEKAYPHGSDLTQVRKHMSEIKQSHKGTNWLVLDGYHFDHHYQRNIKDMGFRLMVIDDMGHLDRYHADILLNQNIHAPQINYRCDVHTTLLLGSRYALLRDEFLANGKWNRKIPEKGRNILISLGGSDPKNVTLSVINAIEALKLKDIEVRVIIGFSNPHFESLKRASTRGTCKIQFVQKADNMPDLMKWADIAVSAGGSTCWEMAYTGLPNVVVVVAKNQAKIAEELALRGISVNLGRSDTLDSDRLRGEILGLLEDSARRSAMSELGQKLIDGYGVSRVFRMLTTNGIKRS